MEELSNQPGPATHILDALLAIVADGGLDKATVREVAGAAGVAIGTVQHYFPTKDDMVFAAFAEVVRRIKARVEAVPLGDDVRANLTFVLQELLPLDERRRREVRIQLAFAAKTATTPSLAPAQRAVLDEVRRSVAAALATASGTRAGAERCLLAAEAVVAAVDGLASHAVSSGVDAEQGHLVATLDLVVTAVLRELTGD